jgi:HAD superfamily hydrolase (TIGR01509 family)
MNSNNNKNGFAAIFDMDGVLVQTYDIMWSSHNKELASYGVHLTEKDIALYLGNSLRDNVKAWNERYNLSIDFNKYSKHIWAVQEELFKKLDIESNLVNLLEELNTKNVPKGIGTCAHRSRAESIIENTHLKKYFPVLVTSENVPNHKPHPDIYLEVARRLGVQPEKCVVLEDAKNGIQAARAGNMKAIGFLRKHNSLEELADADLIISDFSQINYDRLHDLFD